VSFKYIVAVIIIPVVFILDQITKRWAVNNLKGRPAVDVIKGFFDFRYVDNPGAAWGIFGSLDASIRKPFFVIVSIIAILFIIYFFIRIKKEQRVLSVAISFILGGAFGNFYDRSINGYVVDFIHWFYKDYHWPTFNIADSAISFGVILMIFHMIFLEKGEAKEKKKSTSELVEGSVVSSQEDSISDTEKRIE